MRTVHTYGDSGPLAKVHMLVAIAPVSEVDRVVRAGRTVTLDEYRRMSG
jgi:hypothetical protein